MKQKIKLLTLSTLLFGLSWNAHAQMEYLVTIHKDSGNFRIIKNLPEIEYLWALPNYACFDQRNKRFIFLGINYNKQYKLYTVDAISGRSISRIDFAPDKNTDINIMEFEYATAIDKLCGMLFDKKSLSFYFINIDPFTGRIDRLSGIQGMAAIWAKNTSFDQEHCRYIFKGEDTSGRGFLFSLDAKNGRIISKALFPDTNRNYITELQYSKLLKKPCGIMKDTMQQWHFVHIDMSSGNLEKICPLPFTDMDVAFSSAVDDNRNQYIIRGKEDGVFKIYSIDVTSGKIISSPEFLYRDSLADNVIMIQCDNENLGKLYALHWSSKTITDPACTFLGGGPVINVFPNPFRNTCWISADKRYNELSVELYNAEGKKILEKAAQNSSLLNISGNSLAAGSYLLSVYCDGVYLKTEKVVIR